jgi:PhoPQ-activated pathogenicity-related protein
VPDNVDYKRNATLWITGWNNGDTLPSAHDEDIVLTAALAMGTGTIAGALFQIPNEKVVFSSDPEQQNRGEDAIIAFTWDHFLKDPSDPTWLVRLPMVKASLRAMDTITDYVSKSHPELDCQLDYYSVAGASKRGWTTWLVGAVDPARVMVIIPLVLDAVNFVEVMHHQFRSYGGWAVALEDYWVMNITSRFDMDEMHTLQTIEDPYWYFDRLTMPKLIVNAVGDEFQQPDDTNYWWNDLPEPKHFLMIPNAEHSLATGIFEATPAIGTFILHHLKKKDIPRMKWEISNSTGDITLHLNPTDEKPLHVDFWTATTCADIDRRDFRFLTADDPCPCGPPPIDGNCLNLGVWWKQTRLSPEHKGGFTYVGRVTAPSSKGVWTASFIDVTYRQDEDELKVGPHGGFPYTKPGHLEFTTQVSIWPQEFPYDDCYMETCYGTLL